MKTAIDIYLLVAHSNEDWRLISPLSDTVNFKWILLRSFCISSSKNIYNKIYRNLAYNNKIAK
jgi:hypothetical protein